MNKGAPAEAKAAGATVSLKEGDAHAMAAMSARKILLS
jgi:hypothetical protein